MTNVSEIKDLVRIKRSYAVSIIDFGHKSKYMERAEKCNALSHYTNIEALLTILSERKLKASRIDYMDDLQEKRFIKEMIDQNEALPYIISFDNSCYENIALWHMYTKNDTGVRITFYANKLYNWHIFRSLFQECVDIEAYRKGQDKPILFPAYKGARGDYLYPEVYIHTKISDVIYNEKIYIDKEPLPAGDIKDWLVYAIIKAKEWRFQNETRVVADFEPYDMNQGEEKYIPRFDYLKLPINFEMLDKIVITCSPWMGEQMKRMLKQRIQEIDLGIAKEQVIVKDSKFTNLIQRK